MLAHRAFQSDLNTRPEHVLSVGLACLLPFAVLGAAWHWLALMAAIGMELGVLWANRHFLSFLHRHRGTWFATCGALELHLFYILCGVGTIGGLVSYWRLRRHYPGPHRAQSRASVAGDGESLPVTASGFRGDYRSK
jgi:hypothetical protein